MKAPDPGRESELLLRKAQEALQASEERYRVLFDASSDTIITTDEDGRIVGWNQSAERMFGYAAAEVTGQPVAVIVPHGFRDRHQAGLARVKSGGERHIIGRTVEMQGLRRDGSVFPLEFSLTAWNVASGRYYTAIIRDITERRLVEEQMERIHSEYRSLLNAIGEGVHWIGVDGLIRFENPAAAGMLGHEVSELIGKPAHRTVHHTRADGSPFPVDECPAHATLRDGLARHVRDEVFWRKDGTSFPVEYVCTTIRDEKGRPAGAVVVFTDVTERRRAAELLRESEERYRLLFDGSPLPMWLIDQETLMIAAVNEAAVRHYGYSREEFLSKTMHEIWHPEEVATAVARLAESSGEPWSGVRRHFKKGGACINVEVFSHTVQLIGRRYRLSAIRDITQQLELEERFRQSQKMEAVGRLAGGVAHDFNNLLTVMLGYSDVLLQGLDPGPLHEATQEIRRAGERAASLTRQLLAFSRKQTLVPEVLDLGDVVRGLSAMVERLIGEDIEVSVVVSPNLGRVRADRGQVEQVVVNLAVNARDAMPKGGNLLFELQNVELDDAFAATHAEVAPGPHVLLAISDTGAGMDAETRRRIFEPFFTTKEAGKGTGLGLSTVHGIVLQSGGAIDAYSEPGLGTTFKVYLPRIAGDAAVSRMLSGAHPALAAGSETILVVEDEAAIRQLTKVILREAGYNVLVAEDPAAAERIARSHPGTIHLMLTDVVMPGIRGPELAARVLRLRPDLQVLYMSGYTDDAIAHHGMLDPGTEFLPKPFTPLRLTQKIREVLGRSGR